MRILLSFIVLLALGLVIALPQLDSVQRDGRRAVAKIVIGGDRDGYRAG